MQRSKPTPVPIVEGNSFGNLSVSGTNVKFTDIYSRKGQEKSQLEGSAPELWSIHIVNRLLSSDSEAREASGVRSEITYYDKDWQRLFGPIQGCWMIEKGREAQPYLSDDPVTIEAQDRRDLVITIRAAEGHSPYGIGKESLPFFLWENSAFELGDHYLLRIVLRGNTIQQTLYCKVADADKVRADIKSIPPPPFLLS